MQIDPVALPLDLVDLALAVLLAAQPRTRAPPRPEGGAAAWLAFLERSFLKGSWLCIVFEQVFE
jgi:hypothetical protein